LYPDAVAPDVFVFYKDIYEENVRRAKNEGKQESAPDDHN
jgi:hypothetical protein